MPNAAENFDVNILSYENLINYVLPHYGIYDCNITEVKFKNTDKQRAVYKIDYKNNSYCLKKVYYNKEDLLFVYSAMEWVYKSGINVPKLIPTKDNGRYVNFNDMLFILTPWIEGTKCDYDTLDEVWLSAKTLAKIHNHSKSFVPIEGSSNIVKKDDIYISIQKHFSQMLNSSNLAFKYGDKFSKLFLEYFDQNLMLAKIAVDIGSTINCSNLSSSLCHLDYVNKNLILDEHKNLWLIDFDKCAVDYCAHDISYFLRRILRRTNTSWDIDLAINCLNYYTQINPLTIDDFKYILVYLSFPQKYWKVSRDYFNNISKCNKKAFYTILKKSVEKPYDQLEFIYSFGKYIEKLFNTKIT